MPLRMAPTLSGMPNTSANMFSTWTSSSAEPGSFVCDARSATARNPAESPSSPTEMMMCAVSTV